MTCLLQVMHHAENKEKAASNSFAVVQNMGQGKVVLLLENTQYRMFWIGPYTG